MHRLTLEDFVRQVLRFSFALPPRERMAELSTLFAAAMHFIDAVGAYKLKPEQRLRAERARKEAAAVQWRKQDERRREEAEERRNAKRRDEAVRAGCRSVWREAVGGVAQRLPPPPCLQACLPAQEKLKRLTPAAREKLEARRSKVEAKRHIKSRVKVM